MKHISVLVALCFFITSSAVVGAEREETALKDALSLFFEDAELQQLVLSLEHSYRENFSQGDLYQGSLHQEDPYQGDPYHKLFLELSYKEPETSIHEGALHFTLNNQLVHENTGSTPSAKLLPVFKEAPKNLLLNSEGANQRILLYSGLLCFIATYIRYATSENSSQTPSSKIISLKEGTKPPTQKRKAHHRTTSSDE